MIGVTRRRASRCESATAGGLELGDSHVVRRVADIDQMVGYLGAGLGAGLGGADIHLAVDLHRIHRDDLTTNPSRHLDGYFRFSSGGGAENGDRSQETTVPSRW